MNSNNDEYSSSSSISSDSSGSSTSTSTSSSSSSSSSSTSSSSEMEEPGVGGGVPLAVPAKMAKEEEEEVHSIAEESSPALLFHFDPAQMFSIIKRRAMLKELASCYHAECLSYRQVLFELQGKWEQELCTSSLLLECDGSPEMHVISNPKFARENQMPMEIAHTPLQKTKHMSSVVSVSNEDVSADIMENSTGASNAPLRRHSEWNNKERDALRRGLLMFGLGRSKKVRSVMQSMLKQMRHGLGDIADCCWEFVRICGLNADEKERSYAEKLYEKSKDLGIEVGAEISSRVGLWDRIEKLASVWLRRLMLLDSLGNALRLCASKETQQAAYNAIDNLKDGVSPFDWWGREADLALLSGVYKHGFGNYEALQKDPQFTSAFRPPVLGTQVSKSKDRFHLENDPENLALREGDKFAWPEANILTRRLRRLVDHISRIEKESDAMGKNIKEKPTRGWTKREKLELVKILMMWGCPPVMDDSANVHWQFLRNQASMGPLKNRDESSIENCIKSLRREMLQLLESSDSLQDKEHTNATESGYGMLIGPKVLSYKTAVRLKERLDLIDTLKQAMDILREDWGHLSLPLSQRNNMPSWWEAGHHDRELVKGVLAHGFGNWETIFESSSLNFSNAYPISESGIHLDPKACMKRLRFICSNLRRHLRKLKARRKRNFVEDKENEMTEEPRRFKRTRHIEIPRTPDGRPVLPLALTDRITILDLGTIEYKRAGFHTDRHVFPIGFTSMRIYASMVDKVQRTTYTCTIRDGGSAGPLFRVIPDDSPGTVIERDSASGAWAIVAGASSKIRGIERQKITISGTEMFGLSHPTVIQLLSELPGAEYCSTFCPDYPNFVSQSQRQSIGTGISVNPSIQDDSESRDRDGERDSEVKRKSTGSFQSEQSTSDSSEELDSSDSSVDGEDFHEGVTCNSDKIAEEKNMTRRNLLLPPCTASTRERYLDINADPEEEEELESS